MQKPDILVAPNALKGSLSAYAAASAMAEGIRRACPDARIHLAPLADGGDGWLEVINIALALSNHPMKVSDPLGRQVEANLLYDSRKTIAYIELAQACGLALLAENERNPLVATSHGLGELITAALDLGATEIIIGIGGSATNDGGIGMAQALGAVFLDRDGEILPASAHLLRKIAAIDFSQMDPRINHTRFHVYCDVSNPLLGPLGATHTFGPQKGATARQREQLETGMKNLAMIWQKTSGRDLRNLAGAGAAGGLGAGCMAFLGAQLHQGADYIFEILKLDSKLEHCDLVLTAEGCLDHQSTHGKAPLALAARARLHGVPCIAMAGEISQDFQDHPGEQLNAYFSFCPGPVTRNESMINAANYLTLGTEQIVRCFLAGISATE